MDPEEKINQIVLHTLDNIGVSPSNISIAKSMEESISILRDKKPHYLACYINPKDTDVFAIIDEHKKIIPNSLERYFLAFSEGRALYTFAQALEEDIDGYIIEPFSQSKVLTKLNTSLASKVSPSSYKKGLIKVKDLIGQKDLSNARILCRSIMFLHPRPAMAYFYLAKIEEALGSPDLAIKEVINGLKLNKEHYHCLIYLHELYFQKKDFDRAYRVLKKVLETFPLSMHRMFDVFRSGISSGHFDEIQIYCLKLLKEEGHELPIIRFCCAGLIVCAMNTLGHKSENNGIALLKQTLKYSKSDPRILKNIFMSYYRFGLHKNANKILDIFKKEDYHSHHYHSCRFLKELNSTLPLENMIANAPRNLSLSQYDEDCCSALLIKTTNLGIEGDLELVQSLLKIGTKQS